MTPLSGKESTVARQLSVIDDKPPPAPTVTGERTIRIPVSGMTCAACQARVQRALQRQPGVVDAARQPDDARRRGDLRPGRRLAGALVEAIRETGYGAELPPAGADAFAEQEARDRAQAEEFRELGGRRS